MGRCDKNIKVMADKEKGKLPRQKIRVVTAEGACEIKSTFYIDG